MFERRSILFIVHEMLASGFQENPAWLIDGPISAPAKLPFVQRAHLAGINANAEPRSKRV